MSEEPHDSAYVYSSRKKKHWHRAASKVAQSERAEKSRGQWILLGLLTIFVVLGGTFFYFELEVTVINPPAQVVGVCPPPAYVNVANDCIRQVCTINSSNQQTCTFERAGYIPGINGTGRIVCAGNVCVGTP